MILWMEEWVYGHGQMQVVGNDWTNGWICVIGKIVRVDFGRWVDGTMCGWMDLDREMNEWKDNGMDLGRWMWTGRGIRQMHG